MAPLKAREREATVDLNRSLHGGIHGVALVYTQEEISYYNATEYWLARLSEADIFRTHLSSILFFKKQYFG